VCQVVATFFFISRSHRLFPSTYPSILSPFLDFVFCWTGFGLFLIVPPTERPKFDENDGLELVRLSDELSDIYPG
jgi:hypothetical protein